MLNNRKSFILIALFSFLLLLTSCNDDEKVNPDFAELEIKVIDNNEKNIAGAEIKLYKTQSDRNNGKDVINTKTSDQDGKVLFKKLSEEDYYYSGQKNQLYGEGGTGTLKKGDRKKVTLTLK